MQKLLSLPPNLIDSFHQLEEVNHTDWFCTSDPVGSKLGSGGGTTWLLQACHQAFAPEETFSKWKQYIHIVVMAFHIYLVSLKNT